MSTIEFSPEQKAKARQWLNSLRGEDEDYQLREELDAELGEEVDSLVELVESEPIPYNTAWTPFIKQARRICELRPLAAPSNPRSTEAVTELNKLSGDLRSALGACSANELLDWYTQQEKKKDELGDDLFGVYEMLMGRELTVWELCNEARASQPTIWRRLKMLTQRGLIRELPPIGPRYTVSCE